MALSRGWRGSISWVAKFYLVGGEGIQTIDSLILTREVGFSPTFPKRGSKLESATILYIYYLRTPEFPFARSLHRVYFLLACNPSCRRPKIHYSTTCNPFLRQKTGCGRKSKLWPSSSIVRSWPPFFVEWGIKKNISYRNIFQWWIGYIFFDPKYVFLIRQQGIEML